MSGWIHCGNSYSESADRLLRIEESREAPIGLESASGKRWREFAFGGPCVSGVFRERLHLKRNRASEKSALERGP